MRFKLPCHNSAEFIANEVSGGFALPAYQGGSLGRFRWPKSIKIVNHNSHFVNRQLPICQLILWTL